MDKKLAQDILANLNTPMIINCLERYAESQLAGYSKQFEGATTEKQMFSIQGSMHAMRRLMKIRDDAIAVMGVKNG